MKHFLLILTLLLGILVPYGHLFTYLIRYSLMIMLFFTFLDIKIHTNIIQRSHFGVLIGVLLLSLLIYGIICPFDEDLALIAFITSISPTAAFAPVLTDMLKGDTVYVTVAVVINSFCIAFFIPFVLPTMMESVGDIAAWKVLIQVLSLLGIPFFLAQLIRKLNPAIGTWLLKYKGISFYLFLLNIYIATSKASNFIQYESPTPIEEIGMIGLITLFVCITCFGVGYLIGGKSMGLEFGMAIGRKNTMFAIWLCLTFINPIAALGPMFYIIFQNIFNSYQLYLVDK